MGEYPTAAFADQITPGMVIDPSPCRSPALAAILGEPVGPVLVTITGIRRSQSMVDLFAFGQVPREPEMLVHLIGHHVDGRPYTGTFGATASVHVHETPAAPDTAEGAETP